jgi:hypothetical protein
MIEEKPESWYMLNWFRAKPTKSDAIPPKMESTDQTLAQAQRYILEAISDMPLPLKRNYLNAALASAESEGLRKWIHDYLQQETL